MKKLFWLLLLISFNGVACEISNRYLPKLSPIKSILLCRTEYELLYDPSNKILNWAGEELTQQEVDAVEERVNYFAADPDLKDNQKAVLQDYVGSHYDRGHMVPAGDAHTMSGLIESFYLSNMVPQNPNNNRGIWKKLEGWTRDKAREYGEVIVFTGPIFGKEPIRIGLNKIPVPSHLFKIIYDPGTTKSWSFIIPNEPVDSDLLPKYITTLEAIAEKTDIEFLSGNIKNEQSIMD